jgi:hypothetical protein
MPGSDSLSDLHSTNALHDSSFDRIRDPAVLVVIIPVLRGFMISISLATEFESGDSRRTSQ